MQPLAIDLFCGLGGWTEGLLDQGYRVVGFDIEVRPYPAQLVLQDVLTLHGSQFREAALIVASPPCQKYSYMAMPFSLGKKHAREYRDGTRSIDELNACFNACFRIQREASEAAGRLVPMVVENVKGAQPWVGRAKWHYGNFYLYGDVPALMPFARRGLVKVSGIAHVRDGHAHTRHLTNQREHNGVKQPGLTGAAWFDHGAAHMSSASASRKQASAEIAKIPFPLAQHIAKVYKPG